MSAAADDTLDELVDCDELREQHVVLVGMMGVGKTTVGRIIARKLDRPLYDSDAMVEAAEGRTVREIWLDEGEAAYRRKETDALRTALAAPEPSVIAAAGGIVLAKENRELLTSARAHTVWLVADVDTLVARVTTGATHRPLLDDDPEGVLRKMEVDREPLYREVADAIVMVDHRSVIEVARAVLRCCE